MGLYSRYIFPRLMHWSMSRPGLAEERRQALAGVSGDVLEIGFGSGMNLPHYPPDVRKITAVDSNAGTWPLAGRQLEQSPIEVAHIIQSSERLPMADSIILGTARAYGATLWTQDADFQNIAEVKYKAKPK